MGKAKTKGWAAKSQFEISVLVAKSVVMLLYSYENINYMDLIISNLQFNSQLYTHTMFPLAILALTGPWSLGVVLALEIWVGHSLLILGNVCVGDDTSM